MSYMPSFTIAVTTTAPTDSNTTELFNSVTAFGARQMRHLPDFNRLIFAAEHSHAATLKFSHSTNGGTNWDQVGGDITMSVPGAGDIGGPEDFDVTPFQDVKLEWVNGGTTQTTWRPLLKGAKDRQPGT